MRITMEELATTQATLDTLLKLNNQTSGYHQHIVG
jgi:hypothetical protein